MLSYYSCNKLGSKTSDPGFRYWQPFRILYNLLLDVEILVKLPLSSSFSQREKDNYATSLKVSTISYLSSVFIPNLESTIIWRCFKWRQNRSITKTKKQFRITNCLVVALWLKIPFKEMQSRMNVNKHSKRKSKKI